MSRLVWLAQAGLVLSAYLGAVLASVSRFNLPAVVASVPYLAVMASVAAFHREAGIQSLAWGLLAGGMLSAVILLLAGWRYMGVGSAPATSAQSLRYYAALPLTILAMSCFSSYALIDAIWAPRVAEGTLAAFGYGQRLLIAAGNLIIAGPAAVLVSHLADVDSASGARARLLAIVRATMVAGFAIAVCGGSLARPAIHLIFERGAFGPEDTERLASIFPLLLAGMIPMLSCVMLFRGMFQLSLGRLAGLLGVGWTALYFLLGALLSREFGANGIAAAYVVSWWLALSAALMALSGSAGSVFWKPWLSAVTAGLLAAMVANQGLNLGLRLLPFDGQWPWYGEALHLVGMGAIGVIVFACAYRLICRMQPFKSARFQFTASHD